MSVTVRFAAPEDTPDIHRFIVELAVYEREPDAVKATPELLAEQMRHDPPFFECLIAEVDGEPVGIALFCHSYSTWRGKRGLYLEDLYVTPTARRAGAGRALMSELARVALERDCGRLEWAVLDWNQPAIDFYKQLGAKDSEWLGFRLADGPLRALAGE